MVSHPKNGEVERKFSGTQARRALQRMRAPMVNSPCGAHGKQTGHALERALEVLCTTPKPGLRAINV